MTLAPYRDPHKMPPRVSAAAELIARAVDRLTGAVERREKPAAYPPYFARTGVRS